MELALRIILSLSLMTLTTSALAGESLFSRAYTVETVPDGHWQIIQTIRNRSQRSFGSYSAFDYKTLVEYGITDRFQGGFYINTGSINAKGAPDDKDPGGFTRTKGYFESLSAELIYRVFNPVKDPFGLGFYFKPEVKFHDSHNGLRYRNSYGTEYRVLFQQNFLDDRMILVFNSGVELKSVHIARENDRNEKFDWNNELGISYYFPPNWYVGLEARNHNEYDSFNAHEHSVYWVGPVLHYGAQKFWATFGVLRQVYGYPHGADARAVIGDHLFARSHEKWETALKIGVPF